MKYTEKSGNLFTSGSNALGQGVNIHGLMASGIARTFARDYPDMVEEYKRECRSGRLTTGGVHVWSDGDFHIFNIASQDKPGKNARLRWLELGVESALVIAGEMGLSTLSLPRIGCGIGGLDWEDVRVALRDLAEDNDVDIDVWTP